jgi:formylglycine-generating enzyme required for sulfatase activity
MSSMGLRGLSRLVTSTSVLVLLAACGGANDPGSDPASGRPATASPTQAAPTATPVLGETRVDAVGIAQVWVPAGSFLMGTDAATIEALLADDPPPWVAAEFPSEQPQHEVQLTTGYWIDTTEVTNEAFGAFVDAGGYATESFWSEAGWAWVSARDTRGLPKRCADDAPDVPRRCVTWYEAEAYAAWRGGTLPTEAQWEYAARGPESLIYPWGDDWDPTRANVEGSTAAVAVGSFPSGVSWVGAHDMAGNAMEWVADWLDPDYYRQSPAVDPGGPPDGTIKVEKGGWWGSNPFVARAAYRHYEDPPTYGDKHIGFRVVSD